MKWKYRCFVVATRAMACELRLRIGCFDGERNDSSTAVDVVEEGRESWLSLWSLLVGRGSERTIEERPMTLTRVSLYAKEQNRYGWCGKQLRFVVYDHDAFAGTSRRRFYFYDVLRLRGS